MCLSMARCPGELLPLKLWSYAVAPATSAMPPAERKRLALEHKAFGYSMCGAKAVAAKSAAIF